LNREGPLYLTVNNQQLNFLPFLQLLPSSYSWSSSNLHQVYPEKKNQKIQIINSHAHLQTWTLPSTMEATTTPSRSPFYSHTQFLRFLEKFNQNIRRNCFQIHRFLSHRQQTRHNNVVSFTNSIILRCMQRPVSLRWIIKLLLTTTAWKFIAVPKVRE